MSLGLAPKPPAPPPPLIGSALRKNVKGVYCEQLFDCMFNVIAMHPFIAWFVSGYGLRRGGHMIKCVLSCVSRGMTSVCL